MNLKSKVQKGRKKNRWSEFFLFCQNKKCVHTEDNHTTGKHAAFGLCSNCYQMFNFQDKNNKTIKVLEFKLRWYKEAVKQLYKRSGIKITFIFEDSEE